jgi:hypothetical protein
MDEAHGDLTNKHPLRVATADGSRSGPRLPSLEADYSFAEMGSDFEFFVPQLVAIAGGFDRDVVSEYVMHQPAPTPGGDPFALDFSGAPFFRGLGITTIGGVAADWDRRIYAIVRDRWFHCRDWILGVGFVDPKRNIYTRLGCYELKITDPIAARRGGVITSPPTFPVTIFATSSTKRLGWLDPGTGGPPRLAFRDPEPATVVEGAAAMKDGPDPHGLHRFKKRRYQ